MRYRVGVGREEAKRVLQHILQGKVPEVTCILVELRNRDHAASRSDIFLGCTAGTSSLDQRRAVYVRDHELTGAVALGVLDSVTDEGTVWPSTWTAARLLSEERFRLSRVNATNMATIWQLVRAVVLDIGVDIATCI